MIRGGIGFFDSGIGGLSVLQFCRRSVCGVPIYYYGDNARAPYGNLPINNIRAYAHEAFQVFEKLNVRAAVIACNTVTVLMLEELRARYSFPIIGIEPTISQALKDCNSVLVLATNATVGSDRFQRLYKEALRNNPRASIQAVGCAELAGAIERMGAGESVDIERLLPTADVEGVVLGCTHYSLIRERIARFYGAKVFDGNQGVARTLNSILSARDPVVGKACEKSDESLHEKELLQKLSVVTFYTAGFARKKRFQKSKKRRLIGRIKNAQTLYFIGSGRLLNRKFYERMFAFDKMRDKSG